MTNIDLIVVTLHGLAWNMKAHRDLDIDIGKISLEEINKECLDAVETVLKKHASE